MLQILVLLLSFASTIVQASIEDLAHCDPLKKDTHCPPDPAFAGKASFDFTSADWNKDFADFWAVDADSSNNHDHIDFKSDEHGAALAIWAAGQAPTLTSNKYLLFGKVSVEVLAAQGQGLITAIVLKSDSGDEIDWELLGAYDNQAQTNYFYDGQALFNTYNTTYHLASSSFSTPHKYSIDWSPHSLTFSIDDVPLKTWLPGEIPSPKWPQTPMQLKLGIWSVNNDSDPGEIAWAGGLPDFPSPRPVRALFKSLSLEDYTGMCNRTLDRATGGAQDHARVEYLYDERTTGWGDIKIRGCSWRSEVPGVPDITDPGIPAATPTDGDAPPRGTGNDDGDEGDEGGAAPAASRMSSPLAAVLLVLGWILVF